MVYITMCIYVCALVHTCASMDMHVLCTYLHVMHCTHGSHVHACVHVVCVHMCDERGNWKTKGPSRPERRRHYQKDHHRYFLCEDLGQSSEGHSAKMGKQILTV